MKKLFVGNLSFQSREEDIRSLFERFGVVERIDLMTDRETGRSRGFAFVQMTNDGEAANAIGALNGSELGGRSLTVNEARAREERGGGPRPGDRQGR
jgi:cold-inducible RNA-binding protein